jgi:hypothetical protein
VTTRSGLEPVADERALEKLRDSVGDLASTFSA